MEASTEGEATPAASKSGAKGTKTNGKGTPAPKVRAGKLKRPEHLEEVRKLIHRNLDSLMDEHLQKLEQALSRTAKSCSLTLVASMRTRKDLDLELTITGKATLPHVGDTVRMRLEGDHRQLTLL